MGVWRENNTFHKPGTEYVPICARGTGIAEGLAKIPLALGIAPKASGIARSPGPRREAVGQGTPGSHGLDGTGGYSFPHALARGTGGQEAKIMSRHIPTALANFVRRRANWVCEYCHLPQALQAAIFHIDHIQPLRKKGKTEQGNLALACVTCSLKKGARTHSREPETGELIPLFHPRLERWDDHFRLAGDCRLIGKTPAGQATIGALGMNRLALVAIRKTQQKLERLDFVDSE
jgi:hypothetical protein